MLLLLVVKGFKNNTSIDITKTKTRFCDYFGRIVYGLLWYFGRIYPIHNFGMQVFTVDISEHFLLLKLKNSGHTFYAASRSKTMTYSAFK